MSTLQSQYNTYLTENPASELTYDEWHQQVWSPAIGMATIQQMVNDKRQITEHFRKGNDLTTLPDNLRSKIVKPL
jgi:hypothetical protein